MRMKTFTAPTMTEAMELVRYEMGADSIIIGTRDEKDGAVITAAIEDTAADGLREKEHLDPPPPLVFERGETEDVIRQSLASHGVPASLSSRLARMAGKMEADTPTLALAAALDEVYGFSPLSPMLSEKAKGKPAPTVLLCGPPGTGKTVAVAKLATLSAMGRGKPVVVSTDTRRAGGIEQLAAFTRILDVELKTTDNAEDLSRLLEPVAEEIPVLIDTPGTNPFDEEKMAYLASLAKAAGGLCMLVMPASGDAVESTDIAGEFSAIGAESLFITRLDMARRLGCIVAMADAGALAFSDVSIAPGIAEGVNPLNPVSLARLIMPYTDGDSEDPSDESERTPTMTEASP